MATESTPCPAPDILAELRRGALDPDTRHRLIEHIVHCRKCTNLVTSAPDTFPRKSGRMPVRGVVALTASALLLALASTFLLLHRSTPARSGIEALVAAADRLPGRPFEGRLTRGFRHKPALEPLRGDPGNLRGPTLPLLDAARRFEPKDTRDRGVVALWLGEDQRAVEMLEAADRSDPGNGFLLSDLSVAYSARAKAQGHASDYVAAIDTAERAWHLRRSPETAWNRAIALSALNLTAAAERAWDEYLAADADTAWHAEGVVRRAHLRQHSTPDDWKHVGPQLLGRRGTDDRAVEDAVAKFPAQTLAAFETDVIPTWAKARAAGDEPAAAAALHLAHTLAKALAGTGEQLPIDTMAAIERACRERTSCQDIASAHAELRASQQAMESQDFQRATKDASDALARFDRLGTPFALAAKYQLGACMMHQNRFADARATAASLRSALAGKRYRTLEARVLWLQGLALIDDAKPEESITCYTAARQLFQEGRDGKNLAAVEVRLADVFEYAGDIDEAMAHRIRSFELMRSSGETGEMYLALFEAGTSVAQRGWPAAADVFLDESVREAAAHERAAVAALACMWRSILASRRGEFAVAAQHARDSAVYTARAVDPGQRALLAASAVQLGASATDTPQATELVTNTIHFFETAGNRIWLPQLFRQRALMRRRDGDLIAAVADYRRAIDVTEEVLDDAAPAAMRDGFTADARANYEDLIGLLLDQGATREALAYAERVRLIGRHRPQDGDVLAPVRELGPQQVAVVYEVQADALTIWLARRDSIDVIRSSNARDIQRQLAAATAAPPRTETLASLYDLLVRAWVDRIPPGSHLVIVPPPALEGIPFSALQNRQSGRALVDDYVVSVAASLSAAAKEPVSVSRNDALLIVGDPAYEHLPRLRWSQREAESVAGNYARARILTGEQATADAFLAEAHSATVFHFAGHAVLNELAPEASSLVFAAENGEETRIYIHELAEQHLPFKLVVLSACSTATRRSGRRGTRNLARAFIDSGAKAVVGTLWPVRDDYAAEFSIQLHRALTRGEDVARAVRSAQLALRSRDPGDLTWAAFCLMQGNAPSRGGARNE